MQDHETQSHDNNKSPLMHSIPSGQRHLRNASVCVISDRKTEGKKQSPGGKSSSETAAIQAAIQKGDTRNTTVKGSRLSGSLPGFNTLLRSDFPFKEQPLVGDWKSQRQLPFPKVSFQILSFFRHRTKVQNEWRSFSELTDSKLTIWWRHPYQTSLHLLSWVASAVHRIN